VVGNVHVEVLEELGLAERSKAGIDPGMECAAVYKHQRPITISNPESFDALEVLVIVFSSCFDLP